MIFENCVYNADVDIEEVSQYGFVDLCSALVNGVIPGDLGNVQGESNGIEDPSSMIGSKPQDVFDAFRMRDNAAKAASAAGATPSAAEPTK